jgi:ribose/xylose/arabinose/galactoside ABC-type transport system permease subunit
MINSRRSFVSHLFLPATRETDVPAKLEKKEPGASGFALRGTLGWVWTVFGPFLGLVLITMLFAALTRESGRFITLQNWQTIAVQSVIVATAALGMTMIMIAGGIDLSVGSSVALVTVCIALVVKKVDPNLPVSLREWKILLPVALVIGVAVGGVCGAINGTLIAWLKVVPFIVTLGTYTIYRGLAKWLASSTTVYIPGDVKPAWFNGILKSDPVPHWLIVAPGVWIVLILSAAVALMLRYSLLGRYVYAIGSSEATARLCGINVPLIKIVVYTIGGLATGLAGGLEFVYLSATGDPTSAAGLELQVIAAVVIGGGSLSGGEGTVLGTLIGCSIMAVLANGCVHANISDSRRDVFIGIIIIAAVTLDRIRRRGGV